MVRLYTFLIFVAVSGTTALGWRAPAPGNAPQPKPSAADQLAQTVNFDVWANADPSLTLEQALEYLTDRYELNFVTNERAFEDEAEEANNERVLDFQIATKPIPRMFKVTLEQVLRKILSRVPAQFEATYLIRDNIIEITTRKAAAKEVLGNADLPLPPLVTKKIDKRLLSEALEDVSKATGVSVVLDVGVTEAAKRAVSANLMNVPIDTAVKLLADMADLGAIRLDNAIYVTTRDKAKVLRKEKPEGARKKQSK
jgi:hypothetical protein